MLNVTTIEISRISEDGSWNSPLRERTDKAPTCPTKRWVKNIS